MHSRLTRSAESFAVYDGENPIFAVRQSTKRERITEPLEAVEFRALMQKLPQMMRVIGIVAATTGLRISEVLGLMWMDIDWKESQMNVTDRSWTALSGSARRRPLAGRPSINSPQESCWLGNVKPAMPSWRWLFASARAEGKMPPWADTLLDRILQPAAQKAGIIKWVSFHSFRHTYLCVITTCRYGERWN